MENFLSFFFGSSEKKRFLCARLDNIISNPFKRETTMRKISRDIFNLIEAGPNTKRAIAFFILVKMTIKSSTIKNYTVNSVAKRFNLTSSFVKKSMKILTDLGLVRRSGKRNEHVVFCSTKSRYSKINLEPLTKLNLKSIILYLETVYFIEVQKRKDFMFHLRQRCTNPQKGDNYKSAVRTARKLGINPKEIRDWGTSYDYFADKLSISYRKVSFIIKTLEKAGWITVVKIKKSLVSGLENAKFALDCMDKSEFPKFGKTFASNHKIIHFGCNRYRLTEKSRELFGDKRSSKQAA